MINYDFVRHDIHTYIYIHINISIKQSWSMMTLSDMTYILTYIHGYIYRHQHNHDHNIITRYHKVNVKRTPFILFVTCTTLRTTIPNIAKVSNTSSPFTLSFLLPFSWLSYHHPFTLMDPTNPIRCHTLVFSCPYTCTNFIWVLHYLLDFIQLFSSSTNFPLFSANSQYSQNIKGKTRDKQEENH